MYYSMSTYNIFGDKVTVINLDCGNSNIGYLLTRILNRDDRYKTNLNTQNKYKLGM